MSKIHFITDHAKLNPITNFPSILKKAILLLTPLFTGKKARPAGCTVVCGNVPFQTPAERGTARLAHQSKDRRCWELGTGRTEADYVLQAELQLDTERADEAVALDGASISIFTPLMVRQTPSSMHCHSFI